jgi:hypothetical protein
MAPTPLRNFRIDDTIWSAALDRAQSEGVVLSELMRGWLSDYATGKPRVGPGRSAGVEVSRAELTKLRELVDRILA